MGGEGKTKGGYDRREPWKFRIDCCTFHSSSSFCLRGTFVRLLEKLGMVEKMS